MKKCGYAGNPLIIEVNLITISVQGDGFHIGKEFAPLRGLRDECQIYSGFRISSS